MIEAIEARLREVRNIEIAERELFLSRVGRFGYAVIDWFCAVVMAFAIGAFVVGFVLLLIGAVLS